MEDELSYRPICDVWLLARPKVKYWGAYPSGFLGRARDLLGVSLDDAVLHVCAGKVRDYPYRGFGPNDRTLDLDPALKPDFLRDANDLLPRPYPEEKDQWGAVLIDRPYTAEDAEHYAPGASKLPDINKLVRNALKVAPRVGVWESRAVLYRVFAMTTIKKIQVEAERRAAEALIKAQRYDVGIYDIDMSNTYLFNEGKAQAYRDFASYLSLMVIQEENEAAN